MPAPPARPTTSATSAASATSAVPARPFAPTALGSPCRAPALTVRIGVVPRPRMRPLREVLASLEPAVQPRVAPADTAADPDRAATDDLDALTATVRPAARSLMGVLAEILDGRRPAAHLQPLCDGDLWTRLLPRLDVRRASSGPRSGRIRGVRVCAVTPTAAEVSAVIDHGDRARAVAARLERPGDRWRLTALEIG